MSLIMQSVFLGLAVFFAVDVMSPLVSKVDPSYIFLRNIQSLWSFLAALFAGIFWYSSR